MKFLKPLKITLVLSLMSSSKLKLSPVAIDI